MFDSLPEKIKSVVSDSWQNILNKMGTDEKDKRVAAIAVHKLLSQQEVEEIYASDAVARKIVDKIPEEGTRDFIEYSGDDDLEKKMMDFNKDLQVKNRFQLAWSWANLYGGTAVLMVTDDIDMDFYDQPLNLKKINNLMALQVFTRYEVYPLTFNTDLSSPEFGQPEIYRITPRRSTLIRINGSKLTSKEKSIVGRQGNIASITVHKSRLLIFQGEQLPLNKFISNQYWNDSILSSRENELKSYHQAHDAIAHILMDFRQNVIKMKNLAEMVGNEEQNDKLIKRIQLMNTTRSIFSSTLIDMEEEYEQNTPSLTGVKDLIGAVDQSMVANTDMPHTILLGESPKGNLGSDGKSTQRDFYNQVSNEQNRVLTPRIDEYHAVVQAASQGPTGGESFPEDFSWKFVTLWQPTQEDEAKTHKAQAEADNIYLQNNVLNAEEVRKSRFGGKHFSLETTIDEDRDLEVTPEEEEELLKLNKEISGE